MVETEKQQFANIVRATMLVCGGDAPEPDVLRIWWASLQAFDISTVSAAFSQYAQRGKFAPKPSDILEIIDRMNPDGRPGADEAWAMIPKDEYTSAVLTDEMASALAVAQPLLNDGDKIAARMAFKDAYSRIVDSNKLAGILPKWFPSLGMDEGGRASVIADAVRLGRLGVSHAIGLVSPDSVAPMLEMAGEKNLAIEYKPGNNEVAKENLAKIHRLLTGSSK